MFNDYECLCDACSQPIKANQPAEQTDGFWGLRHAQCELPLEIDNAQVAASA